MNITAPGITYFNPAALNLSPAIPNIFNFTTITIAQGSTLKFTEELFHGPVIFLATGDVTISGTLDLRGQDGLPAPTQSQRQISYAGSGGFGGGLGGASGGTPEPGNGPGGGAAGSATSTNGAPGQFTGSQYLIPLIGGSGGGGAYLGSGYTASAPSGGAGGGAILIASSTSITVTNTGLITAAGGGGYVVGNPTSGPGSGGAIRLVANSITYPCSNNLSALGGDGVHNGIIRIESFSGTGGGCPITGLIATPPFSLALPTTAPASLTVTSINGTPINANPFSFPDITINTSSPVVVSIQAQYIPPGTVPKLIVYSETGPDQSITCAPLSGSLQSSTSTASVTFSVGGSRGFVKATWTQ